ncbi:MAG: ABC transporter ATP-binding protein [Chlamydiota bacterium]
MIGSFKNVFFSYDGVNPILENVSVELKEKQFFAIVGPNGGGKTTFLKLLMGLLEPQKGSIELLGYKPQDVRQKIGYVPQVLRFDKHFPISVEELVLQGLLSKLSWLGRFKTEDIALAHQALESVGLIDYKEAPFGSLSGGQAQRALIARALIGGPDLLLLDEPTASIDNRAEQEIFTLLKRFAQNKTVLMVTHDLNAIAPQVDHVLFINRTLTILNPADVCGHFAMGVYHPPLRSN